MDDPVLWLLIGGAAISALPFGIGMYIQLRATRRERVAALEAMEHGRLAEQDRIRHMDWLYRQAYGPTRLGVVQGGKTEECAVIPFRKPETD